MFLIIALIVVVALVFVHSFDLLLAIISFAAVVVGHTIFQRIKKLKASTPESRKRWALPFLALMYCCFFLELFFLFERIGYAFIIPFVILFLALLPLTIYSFLMSIRTMKMRKP
jgi:hypothetical protein